MAKVVSAPPNTGVLMPGAGAIRLNQLQSQLCPLTPEQQDLVSKAKKYALEQSIKNMMAKQTTIPIAPTTTATSTNSIITAATNNQLALAQPPQQKTIQRHQALVLMCRVYVGSISFELKEETVKAAFAPFGAIKSINMSWDPITLKHKGFAFVEYELPEAAELALKHMNGIQLAGRQIKVGRPSNMPQAAQIIQEIQEECKQKNRIYLSNVHPDLFDQELANLLEPFGPVNSCRLAITPDSVEPSHRGYAFIEFANEEAALEALTMDNFDLGGQVLHVCRATTPAENVSKYGTLESESLVQTSTDEDIQKELERTNQEQNMIQNGASGCTDQEQVYDKDSSNILVLRNMITADDEVDDSLQWDIYEECRKFGEITQVLIHVDKAKKSDKNDGSNPSSPSADDNDQVKIFIKYKDNSHSKRALVALDGRFFGGRKISAQYYDRESFRLSDYSK